MGFDLRRSDLRTWLALAAAIGCFATASAVSIGRPGFAAPATTAAIVGAVPAGLWATRVRRKTHALVALGLWGTVMLLAVGRTLADVLAAGSAEATVLTVALWTGTLAAGVATVYLGCREYGSPAQVAIGTDTVDGGGDRFSR